MKKKENVMDLIWLKKIFLKYCGEGDRYLKCTQKRSNIWKIQVSDEESQG